MRVSELSDWPPSAFSVMQIGWGDRVPTHAVEITIGDVQFVNEESVRFKGTFEGQKDCLCTVYVPGKKLAKQLAAILTENKGEELLSIGEVEMPNS